MSALDAWVSVGCASLLRDGALVVDFGFGERPITTLEWKRALPAGVRVVGVDRGAHAPVDGLELISGDFERCASLGPTSVIRAMNVVRSYREDEVEAVRAQLGAALIDGGLLIEGSTDTEGHVLAAWLLRKTHGALVKESLLFHTDFSRGFSPWLFRDWLPRDLRRSVKPGTVIHDAFTRWDARIVGTEARARFESSVSDDVSASAWELAHGFARLTLK